MASGGYTEHQLHGFSRGNSEKYGKLKGIPKQKADFQSSSAYQTVREEQEGRLMHAYLDVADRDNFLVRGLICESPPCTSMSARRLRADYKKAGTRSACRST